MKRILITNIKITLCLFLLTVVTSCEQDFNILLPDGEESVGLNFYISSDVMLTAYSTERENTAAYIDSLREDSDLSYHTSNRLFPSFTYGYINNPEYPSLTRSSPYSYVYFNSGNKRIFFTDSENKAVVDTLFTFDADKYYSLYLTDELNGSNNDADYQAVLSEEPRTAEAGKIGVRFIHLSADAGDLECYALSADGTVLPDALASLSFKDVSGYTFLAPDEAVNGILRLQIENEEINFTTGVPAIPGRNHVVVIRGFANEQNREIQRTGEDGSITKEMVSVASNLRTTIRRSY